jgi:hypothetical protein
VKPIYDPGKYDGLCTAVREAAEADGAIIVIFNGNQGHGFSMQALDASLIEIVPGILEKMAADIRQQLILAQDTLQ